jgi:predicted DNA-binding ribbon-helix-helix protein
MVQEHNMISMDCFNKLEGPSNYMVWKGKIKTILLKEEVWDVVKAIDNEINVASNTIIVEVVDADEEYAIGDNDQATKVVVTKALNKQEQGDGNFGNVSLK